MQSLVQIMTFRHVGAKKMLTKYRFRANSRLAPSRWETALLCNDVSHWVGTSLESALRLHHLGNITLEFSFLSLAAFCALAKPWESFIIGAFGAMISLAANELLDKIKIDDPVGEYKACGMSEILNPHGLTEIRELISNHIQCFLWVITHPCPNPTDCLTAVLL